MARIRNDPDKYQTRSGLLPGVKGPPSPSAPRKAEREEAWRSAPIDGGFYIDFRRGRKD